MKRSRLKRKSLLKRLTKIKKVSIRQAVLNEIIKIKTKLRREENDNLCELCGRWGNNCLHHIIEKSRCPRLYICDANLVLICWYCHDSIHHCTHNNPRYKAAETRLKRVVGDNYEEKLLILNSMQPRMTMEYIQRYLWAMKKGV